MFAEYGQLEFAFSTILIRIDNVITKSVQLWCH